jgi:hypothetical protein
MLNEITTDRPYRNVDIDRLNELVDREWTHWLRAESRESNVSVEEYRAENVVLLAALLTELHQRANETDAADRNAQRSYRAARTVDLRRWLSPAYENASSVDPWTKARRARLMRAELASREAELCRGDDHSDWFSDAPGEHVAAHVAAHLAELSG